MSSHDAVMSSVMRQERDRWARLPLWYLLDSLPPLLGEPKGVESKVPAQQMAAIESFGAYYPNGYSRI